MAINLRPDGMWPPCKWFVVISPWCVDVIWLKGSYLQCHLHSAQNEHITIHAANGMAYGLSYSVSPLSSSGNCEGSLQNAFANLTTTVIFEDPSKPPMWMPFLSTLDNSELIMLTGPSCVYPRHWTLKDKWLSLHLKNLSCRSTGCTLRFCSLSSVSSWQCVVLRVTSDAL